LPTYNHCMEDVHSIIISVLVSLSIRAPGANHKRGCVQTHQTDNDNSAPQ